MLLRLDARAADQAAAARRAQVQGRTRRTGRRADRPCQQQQLFQKNYVSPQHSSGRRRSSRPPKLRSTRSWRKQAARTRTGFHIVRAPYAGTVSEVPVTLGDMAMPGRALVTIYDQPPCASQPVPQTALSGAAASAGMSARAELPGLRLHSGPRRCNRCSRRSMPAPIRPKSGVDLPSGTRRSHAGMFARVWIAGYAR